jgi:hypothetical protein
MSLRSTRDQDAVEAQGLRQAACEHVWKPHLTSRSVACVRCGKWVAFRQVAAMMNKLGVRDVLLDGTPLMEKTR